MSDTSSKLACAETTLRFFEFLDGGENKKVLSLFTAQGIWERAGRALQGHDAIGQALAGRSPSRRTCHLVSNLMVTLAGEGEARVDFCMTAYEGPNPGAGQASSGTMADVRRCVDLLRYADGAWRIDHKSSVTLFRGA